MSALPQRFFHCRFRRPNRFPERFLNRQRDLRICFPPSMMFRSSLCLWKDRFPCSRCQFPARTLLIFLLSLFFPKRLTESGSQCLPARRPLGCPSKVFGRIHLPPRLSEGLPSILKIFFAFQYPMSESRFCSFCIFAERWFDGFAKSSCRFDLAAITFPFWR